jgi:hypothetical protein
VIITDHHESLVGGDVEDAVGDGLAHLGIGEVMHVDPLGPALRLVLPAGVGPLAHDLLGPLELLGGGL